MKIADLVASIGFDFNNKNLLLFKAGLLGATTLLMKFSSEVVKATVSLDNLEKRTGINPDFVKQWEIVASQSNVAIGSIAEAIDTISRAKGDLLAGEGNITAWSLLGVDPTQNPEKVFNDIIEQIGKIEDLSLRTKRLSDLGFDPQLVNLIGKTNKNIDGLNKSLLTTTKERGNLLKLSNSIKSLVIVFGALKEKFVANAEPVRIFFDLIKRVLEITFKITDAIFGFGNAIKILTGLFLVFTARMFPIVSLITGILLVIEDVWTYLEGGESVLGRVIEWFNNLSIQAKLAIGMIGFFVAKFFLVYSVIKPLKMVIKNLTVIKGLFAILNKTNPFAFWITIISGAIFLIKKAYDLWKKWRNRKKEKQEIEQEDDLGDVKKYIIDYSQPNVKNPNATQNYINNNPNVNNTFNINGNQSPEMIANEIYGIQSQVNDASLLMGY